MNSRDTPSSRREVGGRRSPSSGHRLQRRDVLRLAGAGTLAALTGCLGGNDAGSTGDGRADWPHPNFSPRGTSYNPRAVGPSSKPSEAWGVEVGGLGLARPTVYEDTVYYATAEQLRAFAVEDGTERWSVDVESRSGFRSPVTVDSDHVYIGQTGTRTGVLAFTHDGEEVWHAPTESSVWASVLRPNPDDDHVYAADTDSNVFRIRASDGTVEWQTTVFGPVVRLVARWDELVVGTEAGEVVALLDSGAEPTGMWRTKLPGSIQALSIISGGDVIAGAFGAGVAHLRGAGRAGRIGWHQTESSPHRSVVVGPDRVFSTDGSGIHAYDENDGSSSWNADGDYFAPPAGAGDTIFVSETSDGGGVIAYDRSGGIGVGGARLGNHRWEYSLEGGAATGPTPAHDTLFVVEDGGENDSARLVALREE
ncbi:MULTISPECIES: PQQ-binding-like beta-propeller repeat protein [Haloferax]|uniref:PQQ-binding-like beta-propeller repeat protein n=2 Tax=Haloferax TaxID=2251 RepID=A0A6G1Z266_9EURY|nr:MULTISPECIES: PQQ-binding-like beta-propeller repeat protein [Haloferax]KAB1187954.1 PQQ-binding-like beta-propeller repeat protein [Haloferax sp. CBA1149]MRW80622.1 PQQ-binding-like beta-propeller repeat protein [Haloferax marinisediminis]